MKDNFHMGYDLLKAGFNYATSDRRDNENTKLLNEIAEDFVKASLSKAGISINKEEIIYRFYDVAPLIKVTPIVILSVSAQGVISLQFINKTNPLFKNLFVEDVIYGPDKPQEDVFCGICPDFINYYSKKDTRFYPWIYQYSTSNWITFEGFFLIFSKGDLSRDDMLQKLKDYQIDDKEKMLAVLELRLSQIKH